MELSYKQIMNGITTFIFDVDGVLTDASIQITTDGEMLRTMNIRDGYAMKSAIENGFRICVVSGGSNDGVRIRLEKLGITDVFLSADDKKTVLSEICDRYDISLSEVLYMGDDVPDFEAMQLAGLAACPQDAAPEIKGIAKYISHKDGGHGAVRDVIEQVMKVQGKWMNNLNAKYD